MYEGLAVNIMPKSTMNDLGITIEEVSKSQTLIQRFNIEGQCAIGMIYVELIVGDSAFSIFHIIDGKTSYELLLG